MTFRSAGGSLTIEQHHGARTWRLEAVPTTTGGVAHTYWVDDQRRPWNAVEKGDLDAVDSISSPSERSRVLIALLDTGSADNASLAVLLESARRIPSGANKSRVLVAAAGQINADPALVSAYTRAARSISSKADRERALAVLSRS